MEDWWNDIDREKQGTWIKTCPSTTLSITNPTRVIEPRLPNSEAGK